MTIEQTIDSIKYLFYASSYSTFEVVILFVAILSASFYLLSIYSIFIKPRKYSYNLDIKNWPKVTVQIPTRNELVALRCAEKCLKFDYPKNRYEIIIGDDSNKREISDAIADFARKNKIKIVRREENKGYKAGNLNNMLKYSKGEIIIIFDSDFVPEKDFLKKMVAPFVADKKIAAVQSRWGFINAEQNLISRLSTSVLIIYHYITMPLANRCGVSFICGSAEAVRKSVLLKLGGWQEGSLTEDTEFSVKLMKQGYKNIYLEDVITKGESPYTFRGFRRQQMRWAYGTTKVFTENARQVLLSRNFGIKQKFFILFVLFGFVSAPLLALLFVSGTVAFITNTPGPIDIYMLSISMARNILLSSGFIFAGLIGLIKAKRIGMFFHTFVSSMTFGILISFSISIGFFKAFLKRPMQWYLIPKQGNEDILLKALPPNSLKANKTGI